MPPAETTEASEFGPSMTGGWSEAFPLTVRVALSATVQMAQALRYDIHTQNAEFLSRKGNVEFISRCSV